MNITDIIVSALLKKGVFYEARLVDAEVTIPKDTVLVKGAEGTKTLTNITIRFKAEHMSIQIEKDK